MISKRFNIYSRVINITYFTSYDCISWRSSSKKLLIKTKIYKSNTFDDIMSDGVFDHQEVILFEIVDYELLHTF